MTYTIYAYSKKYYKDLRYTTKHIVNGPEQSIVNFVLEHLYIHEYWYEVKDENNVTIYKIF